MTPKKDISCGQKQIKKEIGACQPTGGLPKSTEKQDQRHEGCPERIQGNNDGHFRHTVEGLEGGISTAGPKSSRSQWWAAGDKET
jgi:hypothetical protein